MVKTCHPSTSKHRPTNVFWFDLFVGSCLFNHDIVKTGKIRIPQSLTKIGPNLRKHVFKTITQKRENCRRIHVHLVRSCLFV